MTPLMCMWISKVQAIRVGCTKCGASVVLPVTSALSLPSHCPGCLLAWSERLTHRILFEKSSALLNRYKAGRMRFEDGPRRFALAAANRVRHFLFP